MKNLISVFAIFLFMACSQSKSKKQIVELSCGQCQFGLTSEVGCTLSARIEDKAYFVDGANINDFGDAHDKDNGFCEVIRKAEVEGEIVNNRFVVSSINLLD